MFLTFENALGQQVPLSLMYCSHVITLCLPSPTLNPLLFMKISIIVMYPKGGKVRRQEVQSCGTWCLFHSLISVLSGAVSNYNSSATGEGVKLGTHLYYQGCDCKPLVLHH